MAHKLNHLIGDDNPALDPADRRPNVALVPPPERKGLSLGRGEFLDVSEEETEAVRNAARDFVSGVEADWLEFIAGREPKSVEVLQKALNALGEDVEVDGLVGPATRDALARQRSNNPKPISAGEEFPGGVGDVQPRAPVAPPGTASTAPVESRIPAPVAQAAPSSSFPVPISEPAAAPQPRNNVSRETIPPVSDGVGGINPPHEPGRIEGMSIFDTPIDQNPPVPERIAGDRPALNPELTGATRPDGGALPPTVDPVLPNPAQAAATEPERGGTLFPDLFGEKREITRAGTEELLDPTFGYPAPTQPIMVDVPGYGPHQFPPDAKNAEIEAWIMQTYPEFQQGVGQAAIRSILGMVANAGAGLGTAVAGAQALGATQESEAVDLRSKLMIALEFIAEERDPARREAMVQELRQRSRSSLSGSERAMFMRNILLAKQGKTDRFKDIAGDGLDLFEDVRAKERPAQQFAETVRRGSKEAFAITPENAENPIIQAIGAIGYAAPIIAAGILNPAAGFTVAMALGSGEATQRAIEANASEEEIGLAFILGTAPGAADYAPIQLLINRFASASPWAAGFKAYTYAVARRLIEQGVVEGTTEGVQEFLQNLISKMIYKPDQALAEGVPQSILIGTLAGLMMGAPGAVLSPRGGQGQPPGPPTPQDTFPVDPAAPPAPPVPPAEETGETEPEPQKPTPAEEAAAEIKKILEDGRPLAEQRAEEETKRLADEAAAAQAIINEATADLPDTGTLVEVEFADGNKENLSIDSYGVTEDGNATVDLSDSEGNIVYSGEADDVLLRPVQGAGTADDPVVVETGDDIDRAGEQAKSNPTQEEMESGEYPKGHLVFPEDHGLAGFNFTVETERGGIRKWNDPATGESGETVSPAAYGYVEKTRGADGDEFDVYFGSDPDAQEVYVVDQINPGAGFDELKGFVAVGSEQEAIEIYLAGFSDGSGDQRMGAITTMGLQEFRDFIANGNLKQAISDRVRSITQVEQKPDDDISNIFDQELENQFDDNEAEGIAAAENINEPDRPDDAIGSFAEHLRGGGEFPTIRQARVFYTAVTGEKVKPGTPIAKQVDETVETAAVIVAREIVTKGNAEGLPAERIFDQLQDLQSRMPNLAVRSSSSVANQAYSTPLPLAYVASRLAGIDGGTTVYEPTAGNGALLIEAKESNVTANELNGDRVENLKRILPGATITDKDATGDLEIPTKDVVIANPPFGSIQMTEANIEGGFSAGQKKSVSIVQGYDSNQVDHVIAFKALDAMADDGRAVLIVASVKNETDEGARKKAYNTKQKRLFFWNLNQHYNVVDHFTMSGSLYQKQGAGWPVDVIVIEGRGKTDRDLPAIKPPRVLNSIDRLKGELSNAQASVEATGARDVEVSGERPDAGVPAAGVGGDATGLGNVPTDGGGTPGVVDQTGAEGGRPSPDGAGLVRGSADERPDIVDRPAGGTGEPGGSPDSSQPAVLEPVVPDGDRSPVPDQGTETKPDGDASAENLPSDGLSGRGDGRPPVEDISSMFDEELDNQFGADPVAETTEAAINPVDSGIESTAAPKFVRRKGKKDRPETPIERRRRLASKSKRPPKGETPIERRRRLNKEKRKVAEPESQAEQLPIGPEKLPVEPKPKTVPQNLGGAAVSGAKGLDEATAAMAKLLGGGSTTLGSGPVFNRETYEAMKPHLIKAANHFYDAGMQLKEVVSALIKHFRETANYTKAMMEQMKPNVIQFFDDVKNAIITLGETTEFQVTYVPNSRAGSVDTLIPTNMARPTAEALNALEERVGAIDIYVGTKLNYSQEELSKYFSAEQVDALGLALENIDNGAGFIVGDQTGIGKGRVVAAVMRYAGLQGQTPIFVTQKANLYADMMRDFEDIGMAGYNPFITNNDLSLPLKTKRGGDLTTQKIGPHESMMRNIINNVQLSSRDESGDIEYDFDAIFTTYDQLNPKKGKTGIRHELIEAFAPDSFLVMDESHSAGGSGADRSPILTRARWFRRMVGRARSVFYSSATYAKRPDVMTLYSKTDMRLAVGSINDLPALITRGGVPLQQAVARMLTQAGQYIRRERSFKDVFYNSTPAPVNTGHAESISAMMQRVYEFSLAIGPVVDRIAGQAAASAGAVLPDNSTRQAGADSLNFTSIMHNIVDQMLLSLKVDTAIDLAIKAHEGKMIDQKTGKPSGVRQKPILTVSNTMGKMIEDAAKVLDLSTGDVMDLGFDAILDRYLERVRTITIKDAAGNKTKYRLTDQDLGPALVAMFKDIKEFIANEDLGTTPLSPIDYMAWRLKAAGMKVGEITGRTHVLDYGDAQGTTYKQRGEKEKSKRAVLETIEGFNGGDLDVLIINQSGSAGLSLHAGEKFKDKKKRHMIIVQAEKNIDVHMQILGRIHRTGQVELPEYSQLVADIPAEKRPAAVLAKKMASLNANTTAAAGSAVTSKDTIDFMNDVGDEVIADIVADEPEINDRLGRPLKRRPSGDGFVTDGAARRLTGRLPLMTVKQQEEIYELIEASYTAEIERLESMGENVLEAKTLALDAVIEEETVVFEGTPGATSPFAGEARLLQANVKRLGKPLPTDKVREMVAEQLDGRDAVVVRDETTAAGLRDFRDYAVAILDDLVSDAAIQNTTNRLNRIRTKFEEIVGEFKIGDTVMLKMNEGNFYGVIHKIEHKGKAKNPIAHGTWKVTVLVADSMRTISLPLSKLYTASQAANTDTGNGVVIEHRKVGYGRDKSDGSLIDMDIFKMFDDQQGDSRESRGIVVGNILAGFGWAKGGKIVQYTDGNGLLHQGIFMPRSFDADKAIEETPVLFNDPDDILNFTTNNRGVKLKTTDNVMSISKKKNARYWTFEVPRARSSGGYYYLNRTILAAIAPGEFTSSGNVMRVELNQEQAKALIGAIQSEDVGSQIAAFDRRDIARQFLGIQEGQLVRGEAGAGDRTAVGTRGTGFNPGIDIEKAEQIGRELRAELDRVGLTDVGLQLAAVIEGIYSGTKIEVVGVWRELENLIMVSFAAGADIKRILSHETIHAMKTKGLFTDAEWAILEKGASEKWLKQYNIQNSEAYAHLPRSQQLEEAIAHAYADFAHGDIKIGGRLRPLLNKIKNLLRAIKRAFVKSGLDDAEAIFKRASGGEIGSRKRKTVAEAHESGIEFAAKEILTEDDLKRYAVQRRGEAKGTREQNVAIDDTIAPPRVKGTWWQQIREYIKEREGRIALTLEQGIFDQFAILKHLESAGGRILDGSVSAWKAMLRTQNLSGVMTAVLLKSPIEYDAEQGAFIFKKGWTDGGFEKLLEPLITHKDGNLTRLWAGWLYANRAQRLIKEGRETNMSQEQIDALLPLGSTTKDADGNDVPPKYPEFEVAQKKWRAFNKAMLDMAEQSGTINAQQREVWEHDDYVPFYRALESDIVAPKLKRGVEGQRAPIKHLTGKGNNKSNDMIENMVMNITYLVDSSFKNLAMQRAIKVALTTRSVSPVSALDARSSIVPATEAARALMDIGVDVETLSPQQKRKILNLFQLVPPRDPSIVSVMVNGKAKFYRVHDPLLLTALTAMHSRTFGKIITFLGGAKRLFTKGVTADPAFMLRNNLRDSISAAILTGEGGIRKASAAGDITQLPGMSSLSGLADAIMESDELWDIMAAGAATGGFYNTTTQAVQHRIDTMTEEQQNWLKKNIVRGPEQLWNVWQKVGMASENANRIAMFKAVKARGGTIAEAAHQAQDILNFSARGDFEVIRVLIEITPFLNARLQGLNRMYRAKDAVGFRKAILTRAIMMVGISIAYAAIMQDDERYKALEQWDKDAYWHIYLGDSERLHFRIPKPFELGVLFGSLPERLTIMMSTGKTKGFGDFISRSVLDTFAMNPFGNPLAWTAAEQFANRISFLDRPIEGMSMEGKIKEDRYNPGTSTTAIAIARIFAPLERATADKLVPDVLTTPVRFQHAVRGVFGTLGAYTLMGTDAITETMLDLPPRPEWRIDQIPVVGAFIRAEPALSTRWITDLYKLKKDTDRIARAVKLAGEAGDPGRAQDLKSDNRKLLRERPALQKMDKRMRVVSKKMRRVYDSRTMTPAEKGAAMDILRTQRNRIASRVERIMDRVGR